MYAIADGESFVFVARDGVQYPAFTLPRGGHLLAFLNCLESGLLAAGGSIDPSLGKFDSLNGIFFHHFKWCFLSSFLNVHSFSDVLDKF